MKSLAYSFYAFICQVFTLLMRFIIFYNRPAFIDPAWLSTTSCQYIITYNPVFINLAWLWTISRQYIFGLRHWNHALINHWIILFKSSNSQHGWIFIMVINNQYYDWGFQSRFSAMDIILSMEGIVPSRCRLMTQHLGATLFKLRLHHASPMSLPACTMALGG